MTASLRRDRRWIVEYQIHSIPPSVSSPFGAADGDVESTTPLAEDALTFLNESALWPTASETPPPSGLLQAFLTVGRGLDPLDSKIQTGWSRSHYP
jgi:hypothetical protein